MSPWTRIKIFLLGTVGYLLMLGLYRSLRWVRDDTIKLKDRLTSNIFSIWHGRVLMSPFIQWRLLQPAIPRPFYVLVSRHFDGQLIGEALRHAGLRTVAGSSTRGGVVGMRHLIRLLEEGADIAIMPDGPRGPLHEVKSGVVQLAAGSQLPLIPMAIGFERSWKLGSWDGMLVPKPFSKAVMVFGEPITVEPINDAESLAHWRARVKDAMMQTLQEADSHAYS